MILADDLGKLPGDDDMAPKRKGLRRLRKADRALQKQAQQHEEQRQQEQQPIKGKVTKGVTIETNCAPPTVVPSATGEGRQWDRRHWSAAGLSDLVQTMVVAVREPTNGNSGGLADSNTDGKLIVDAVPTPGEARGGSSKGKDFAQDGKQKGKGSGGGKGTQLAATAANGDEEEGENHEARREAEVRRWAEGLREALERETYVTTAHRVTVAARDTIVLQLVDRTKVRMGARE